MRRIGWMGLLAVALLWVLAWADARPLSVPPEPFVPATGEMAAGSAETARAQGEDSPRPTTPAAEATQAPAWHLRAETVPFSELKRLVPSLETLSGGAAYRVAEGRWGGVRQKVHVLTVDPAGKEVRVRPVLSFDRLFGFETLSAMAEGKDALAAVNGGFADTVGRPAGTVMLGGTLLHPADKRFPSLILGEDLARLVVIETAISLEIGDGVLPVDGFNPWPAPAGISVFTPAYGSTNRMDTPHLAIVVAGGRIAGLQEATAPVPIPSDGFVVAAIGEPAREALVARGKVGGPCTFAVAYSPELPPGTRDAM